MLKLASFLELRKSGIRDTLNKSSCDASWSFLNLFESICPHLSSDRLREIASKISQNCLRLHQPRFNQRILSEATASVSLKKQISYFVLISSFSILAHASEQDVQVIFVKDGKALSELVLADDASPLVTEALTEFQKVVEKSTGVRLPISKESEAGEGRKDVYRLYVGNTRFAREAGFDFQGLDEETFYLKLASTEGILFGNDFIRDQRAIRHEANSMPTRWGLNHLLEKGLGVRWLWPGELGTYVPKQKEFVFEPCQFTYKPRYIMRRQRIPQMGSGPRISEHRKRELPRLHSVEERERIAREAILWLENHQGGWRGKLLIQGQPFKHWWTKYSKDHPDYFAKLPEPLRQPFRSPERVKLRLSNPAVIDRIVEEYKEAGSPSAWKLSPNDSGGFDISEETRAWDIPKNQDITAIVYGEANLTARYVRFWNLVYERLAAINPDVVLNSLAYASYRYVPPAECPLKAKMILSLTPSYLEFEDWKGWAATGSMLILRPNWWVGGAGAPWTPLAEFADFFKYAGKNGMVAFDFDSIHGHWATQGINYYLIARMGVNPELSKEEIIREYVSAFGAGSGKMKEYLKYWEDFSVKAGYPVHVGGHTPPRANGEFAKIVAREKINDGPWIGSLQVLPYLYTEKAIAPAEALLDDALKLAEDAGEKEAGQRVRFIKTGLEHLRLLRDTMSAGMQLKQASTPKALRHFEKSAVKLYEFRRKIGFSNTLWPEQSYDYEDRGKQPTISENTNQEEPDWRAE